MQAPQEVEEEKAHGRRTPAQRRGATEHELGDGRLDVNTGMSVAAVALFMISLTY